MHNASNKGSATTRLHHLSNSIAPEHVAKHGNGTPVVASALPGRTPLDIRLGLTKAGDEAHPLRWGILGAANICADWVRALANVPGATVVAVAARSYASAKSFADEWAIPRAYEGYENLASDAEVDIVYCGTITPLHKEHVLLMIGAGKHVLVEKPISMSVSESKAMYDAAAAKGVMLQEGMWSRFFPATEHARALIEEGHIGEVKVLQGDFGFYGMGQSAEDMAAKRAIHNPSMSCYVAQMAPLAFGTNAVAKVTAAGIKPEGYSICTSAGATIEFDNEANNIAGLTWTMEAATREHAVIIGTTGRITLAPAHAPTQLTIVSDQGTDAYPGAYHGIYVPVDETVVKYPTLAPDTHGVGNSSGYNFPNSSGFTYQAEAVHRCLAAGVLECPQYTQHESLCVTKILDGIQSALEAQAPSIPAPNPVFQGQLTSVPSAAMTANASDPSTPMDIKMGLTKPEDVAHKLRWGFMTAGRICKDMAQACLIAASRGCGAVLGAVAARKLEDAQEFAAELGCEKAYGGDTAYADICADPDIDICYVGTITRLHMEHALMALRAGKHVLCEKPFAASPEEVATMYAAADEAGVMLQEGMWTRFFPATEHARTAMAEGAIGDVKTLQSTFPDRCYPIQAAPMVFGTDTYPVVAAAGSGNSGGGATLAYPKGGLASVSMPRGEFDEVFEIRGTEGVVTIETPGHCPTKVTVNGVTTEYPLEPYSYMGGYPQCNQHGFYYEIEAVHRCIAKGLRETPQHSRADSLQLIWIISQVQAQAGGSVHS